jgi:hypothetical protein
VRDTGWRAWLKDEIGIGDKHALRLIQIFEKFGHLELGGFQVGASYKVLDFLSRATTPEAGGIFEKFGDLVGGDHKHLRARAAAAQSPPVRVDIRAGEIDGGAVAH